MLPKAYEEVANARIALGRTEMIRLNQGLCRMVAADTSTEADLVSAAYNLLAEVHRQMSTNKGEVR